MATKSEPKTRAEAGTREIVTRKVQIRGLTDIMFDRYPGDNDTKLEPWQKLYLAGEEGRTICLPSANIMSFLSAQNTDSAPKRLLDSRKYKAFALACGSFVTIQQRMIPFIRDGAPITFGWYTTRSGHAVCAAAHSSAFCCRIASRMAPKVRSASRAPLSSGMTSLISRSISEPTPANDTPSGTRSRNPSAVARVAQCPARTSAPASAAYG